MNLSGIIPPMVTPLLDQNTLDEPALERLIEHLIHGGVSGLFILGTTGEGPALNYSLRRTLIERTCRIVRQRVPVLVCVSDTAYSETLQLAAHAADFGANAVVAAPPFYWPINQADLDHYFHQLATDSPLPLFLYNMPALTKVSIPFESVERALSHPNIVGMKDSSGSLQYLHRLLRLRGDRTDWPIFVGEEETLAYAVLAGANGGVSGGANVFPQLYVRLYQASAQNDSASINHLLSLVMRMSDLYRIGQGSAPVVTGIKHALQKLGICSALASEPFLPIDRSQTGKVDALVEEIKQSLA